MSCPAPCSAESPLLPQTHNYFAASEGEVVGRMQDLERLCEALTLEGSVATELRSE